VKKYKRHIAGTIGAGLIAVSGNACAAPPTTEELVKQIEALRSVVETLQKQVKEQSESIAKTREALPEGVELATTTDLEGLRSSLEDYKYSAARDREYSTAITKRGLTIGGTLTGSYTASSRPSAATSNRPFGTAAENSFNASATLSFAGNLYKDYADGRNLDYKLGLSFSNPKFANGAASTNSPAPGDSVVRVTDAYLQYSILKSNGGLEDPKLTLAFGQQKIPFGLEAQVSDELKPTVSSAQFLGGLGNINKRQIGLILRGDFAPTVDYGFNYRAPLLEYALGVVNGNGDNTADDNTRKDWLARIALTLPVDYNSPFRELKFGTSYYLGSKNLNSTGAGNPVLVDAARTTRTGIDVYYNHNPFGATYERADGRDEALIVPASLTNKAMREVKSSGQVLTVFYNFGDIAQWSTNLNRVGKYDDAWPTTSQVYFRYDKWDPNRAIANNEVFKTTIGYNLFFAQTTKFQIGLTRTTEAGGIRQNDLTALFQYGF
jgi:hypothetical protein